MSNSTVDKDPLLQQLNDEKTTILVPAIVYVMILMLIGLIGNGLVWFFYGFKIKTTPASVFILCLALFDLISCVVAMPMEIAEIFHYYTFESVPACKVLRFINHFASIASSFTLVAIAVDRYKRICKPFGKQFSIKHAKIICGLCAGLSLVFSWPSAVFNTVVHVNVTNTYNVEIIGYDCATTIAESYSIYVFVFNVVLFLGFTVVVILLTVLYFFVGRQLFRHKKFRFYVAQNALRRTASGQNVTITSIADDSYDQDHSLSTMASVPKVGPPLQTFPVIKDSILEDPGIEEIFDDPPDEPPQIADSVMDLREFVTKGMPEVACDRPESAGTDRSGISKKSIQSIKSVKICDPSQNQIFDIESRTKQKVLAKARPGSGKSDSGSSWSGSITRPGSASSIESLPTRPSSAGSHASSNGSGPRPGNNLTKGRQAWTDKPRVRRPSSTSSTGSRGSKGSRRNVVVPETIATAPSESKIGSTVRRTCSNRSVLSTRSTDTVKELRMKILDVKTIKYTLIMLVITIVFVISFVPYLVLESWKNSFTNNELENFSDAELVGFTIGMMSYFLNSAVNPLIYGFFNSQFREFFHGMFCTCCASKIKK